MKFKMNTELMLKNLNGLMKAVPARTTLPILENFLIELKKGLIRITASDNEVTVRAMLPTIESDGNGTAVVPARILTELLKTLPSGDVTFETNESLMNVEWDNGKSSLPLFEPKDYPEQKKQDKQATSFKITQKALQEALNKTAYAASSDQDARPAMSGICMDYGTDGLTVVATDSHKLICFEIQELSAPAPASVLIPKKSAMMLKPLLDKDGEVTVVMESTTARFQFGSTELVTKTIAARYPNYKAVIPKDNANIMTASRESLLSAIKRIAICSDKASMMLKVELKYNQAILSAQDLGFNIAAREELACEYDGSDMTIGFKAPALIEILASMQSDNIDLHFKSSNAAMLITPAAGNETPEPIKAILMPMAIK